jgi:hypothetical protein
MTPRYTFRDSDRAWPWRVCAEGLALSGHPSEWETIKGFRATKWRFAIRRFKGVIR